MLYLTTYFMYDDEEVPAVITYFFDYEWDASEYVTKVLNGAPAGSYRYKIPHPRYPFDPSVACFAVLRPVPQQGLKPFNIEDSQKKRELAEQELKKLRDQLSKEEDPTAMEKEIEKADTGD